MPRFSLKSMFIATALIALEVFFTKEMVFMRFEATSMNLILAWLLYGILLGGALVALATGRGVGAFMLGMIVGGFGQVLIWAVVWSWS